MITFTMTSWWKRIKLAWKLGYKKGQEVAGLDAEQIDAWDYWNENPIIAPEVKKEYEEDMKYMGMTPLDMVREFAKVYGHAMDKPYKWDEPLRLFRQRLINEEANEVLDAIGAEKVIKELADLVYVTYGMAATYGWDLDEAVRRVHKSNMSKLGEDGKPIFREDGKVLKGPNYQEPYVDDLVQ